MEKLKLYIAGFLLIILQSCETQKTDKQINIDSRLFLGSDRLISENIDLIKNKRLGIVANKASILSNGVLLIDTLRKIDGIHIKTIFAPEHGFNANTSAGQTVYDSSYGTIPVHSLYGKNAKPSAEMLKDIDLIIFDLQDIGTRFYTYISTLFYVMQAASENKIPFIVLDRPDPIGGLKVEGPVLTPDLKSYVGIAPIPVIHGMTIGELAEMFAGEKWIASENTGFKIIKMENWRRGSFFNDYRLTWVNPSPNIPDAETALIYPATAFLEGTNISEGRGTDKPFKQIGAPFINPAELMKELDSLHHTGLSVKPAYFVPLSTPGSENPKFENLKCSGIVLKTEDIGEFKPVEFGIKLLFVLEKLYPEKFKFNSVYFDKLAGERSVREMLISKKTPDEIIQSWQSELNEFIKKRTKYLLY